MRLPLLLRKELLDVLAFVFLGSRFRPLNRWASNRVATWLDLTPEEIGL